MNDLLQQAKIPASEKLKFLFVSKEALIGDLAWSIKKEGHSVKYCIEMKTEKDICDGFIEKCDDWKKEIDWADVIVFDDIDFGPVADDLRKKGKFVIGGSTYTDKLELDRDFGQDELAKAGVIVLPHWKFTSFDEAIAFVKKNPGRYVIKPSGEIQDQKELLYVGKEEDGDDVIDVLELYKKSWSKKIKVFQLQKFAQGVEVAVGAFFNGKDFVKPIHVNFEHKKLFAGDIGPNTGEMGTVGFFAEPNKLFNETMAKMKELLAKSGYVGYIDLNCIANTRGIYPLEWTSRFGYPTISLQIEGITSNLGKFFYKLAKGEATDIRVKKGFQICIVIAVPPFPYEDPVAFKRYSEDSVVMFKKEDYSGVHLGEVKLIDGQFTLAGQSGYSLVITASGMTMAEASDEVYKRVRNIILPNMFYRTDIGERWVRDSDLLLSWGYL